MATAGFAGTLAPCMSSLLVSSSCHVQLYLLKKCPALVPAWTGAKMFPQILPCRRMFSSTIRLLINDSTFYFYESRRNSGAEHGTHSLNQQMTTAGLAGTLAPSTSSVNEESCWLFEDHEGRKPGPHSLVELYSWYHYGYIVDSVMERLCPVDVDSPSSQSLLLALDVWDALSGNRELEGRMLAIFFF
ncbi:hypothetical protein KY290_034175 [Solanum tuberosum]|uniref:GYF domain-containing protein n=1 Tax=Solanum tuberosum TaxID=4113 RepID=A0ABQ7U2H6_SOLTU|nr:hypothetical protein KY289_033567 [Solanum tuberosum]KAH0741132.1 hypothetical protein KY290_034175 [Solanum tuberosum]